MLRKLSALVLVVVLVSFANPVASQMNNKNAAPPSDQADQLGTAQAPSQKVEGGRYPHQPPHMGDNVNSGAPPVPTNPVAPGAPTPGTEAKPGSR
jgi:hypothetical protein